MELDNTGFQAWKVMEFAYMSLKIPENGNLFDKTFSITFYYK